MENALCRGKNYLLQICHLNQIEEHKLVDHSCRLKMQHNYMKHWMHDFFEDEHRQEGLEMAEAIPNFGENLQQKAYSNDVYLQSAELEIIEEVLKLMMEVTGWSCYELRKTVNHKLLWARRNCINKVIGKQQNKIWDPGELKAIAAVAGQQQGTKANGQLQHKVFDPRGLQKETHDQEIMNIFVLGDSIARAFILQNLAHL
jgi:hypothetical protein